MKKILTILLAVCLLLQSGFVFAAQTPSLRASLNQDTFTVEVSGSGFSALDSVFVVIAPKDIPLQRVVQYNQFAYSDQPIVDSTGAFVINPELKAGSLMGWYTVHAIESATGAATTTDFLYQSAADFADVLIHFNENATTKAAMKSALDTYGVAALLDMTEYQATPAAQQIIADRLFDLRGAAFADILDLHEDFKLALLLGGIPYVVDAAGLLAKYGDALGQGTTDDFFACTDAEETAAGTYFKNKTFNDAASLIASLPEAIFVGKVNAATTASALQSLFMTDYAAQLNLDKSYYNNVINKTTVFSKLLELTTPRVTGYTDAETKFAAAALAAYNAEQGGGLGGLGGGGGAGGGGGGVSAYQPPVENPSADKEQYYNDLQSVPWAVDHINYLTRYGVLSGDGSGSFRPNDTVTRAEFVKMIVTAFKLAETGSTTGFSDVKTSDWYAPYVATGVAHGLVKGISDTYFGANDKITRQDLAVICFRAAQNASMILGKTNLNTPTDLASVADYAKAAVESFYAAGVINGDESGAFNPARNATRAEAAKIVSGLLALKGGY